MYLDCLRKLTRFAILVSYSSTSVSSQSSPSCSSRQELALGREDGELELRLRSESNKVRRGCNAAFRPQEIGRAAHAAAAAVQDVRVDHRRLHVLVSEELLDRANIVPLLEQVGRERVAEGVTADPAGDAELDDGRAEGSLDDGLVQVMAALDLRAGVDAHVLAREDELPAPVALGARVLPGDGVGQEDVAEAIGEVVGVDAPNAREPGRQRRADDRRKGDDAVALALGVADEDAVVAELDVLDAQAQAPRAGACRFRREASRRAWAVPCILPMTARTSARVRTVGQAAGRFGADDRVEVGQLLLEDVAVQKEQRRQRLGLGRRADGALDGEMGDEGVDLGLAPSPSGWRLS